MALDSLGDSETTIELLPEDMLDAIYRAGGHVARSQDDYSDSAVHCYQDEHGQLQTVLRLVFTCKLNKYYNMQINHQFQSTV